jgi:hypothetical protein
MSVGRLVSAALVAGGLLAATVLADPPSRSVGRVDGYLVLTADLHIHSFFGDGALAPWEIVREARFRGLDVIAITNHNQLVGSRMAVWSARGREWPIVLVGQEVTAPRFHMTAVGLSRSIDWRLSVEQAAEAAHAQGGVAIAAHPNKRTWGLQNHAALQAIDGIEMGDPFPSEGDPWDGGWSDQFHAKASNVNGNLATIGGSDFHFARSLGRVRTYLLATDRDAPAVLTAIREGRTVSRDGDGVMYGDPALVRLVAEHLASQPENRTRERWRSLAAVAVLSGLALLVLLK